MELYEFKHLATGKKYTVFMDKKKAEKQLAELNKDRLAWEMRLFFEAIDDEDW